MSEKIDLRKIFEAAIELHTAEDIDRYLDDVCGVDAELRAEVETLIRSHEEAGRFLGGEDPSSARGKNRAWEMTERNIGPYKLLQQIGEGGFGVVYMAEQQQPVKRRVAVKIIKPGMDTKEVVARFEAERQALALMDHVNIAKVFDGGTTDLGRPYFVMEMVKGVALTEYCDNNRLSIQQRLELFGQVCRAIQHAHQKGVIHRDIKPSNVMVTMHDGVAVPKVIDFGVAKAISHELTEKTMFTAYGQMIGTPQYMSPEQAEMSGLDIDTRSDVYSLGVLLYELITGTTPLDKNSIQRTAYNELCRQIREVEAPKPSARISTLKDIERSAVAEQRQMNHAILQEFVSGDLDRIVLKALQKDREQRYESPKEIVADIERFLKDEPVQAVPPSPVYLARKYFQRNRAAILTAAVIVSLLILATAFSSWQAIRATRYGKESEVARNKAVAARKVADDSKLLAEKTAEERRRELYAANMQLADQLWNSPNGDLKKIEELLAAWIPVDGSADLREFSWRYQWTQLYKGAAVTKLKTTGATLSADGNLLTANEAGIHEWDESGIRFKTKWSGDASEVTFSPDGRWAAIKLNEETQLVEIATGDPVIDVPHALCSFSARSEYLAAWTPEGQKTQVWRLSGDEPVAMEPLVLSGDAKLPNDKGSVQLRDDGRAFLMRGHPGYWQVTMFSGKHRRVTWDHRGQAAACTWSTNGEVIVSTVTTGMLHLRLRHDARNKLTISSHGTYINVLRFSPDGTRLAVGGFDGTIDVWDTSALMELSSQTEPNALASGVSDNEPAPGPRLAPSAHDENDGSNSILLSSARPRLLRTIKAHLSGGVQSLAFSADGTKLASYAQGESKLWDLEQVKARYEVANFGEDLFSGRLGLSFENSEQGAMVASIDSQYLDVVSGEIRVGDRIIEFSDGTHGELTELGSLDQTGLRPLLRGPLQSIVQLIVEDESHERRKVELRRTKKEDPRSMRLCFSPDGTTLAIAGSQHGTSTINLATGRTQRFPMSRSQSVAISRDNLLAMDGFTDVLVWDLRKDQRLARLDARVSVDPIPGNGGGGSLAFSPDGRFLAIATGYAYTPAPRQCDLKVWRVSDMQEVGGAPVFKHERVMSDITFTPDSAYFIATCHDGIVRVWNTDSWELLDRQIVIGRQSRAIAISSDGKTLATGAQARSRQGQIILWDFTTGKKIRVLSGPTPWALDFSSDGKTLVSGSSNHNVILWDVATGMQLRTFHAHSNAVMGAAFSPDGNTLATVGNEGVLRLWKAASFEEIEAYPTTLESMFRLGQLRMSEDRYEDAERILVTLLKLQQEQLPSGHGDIERTRAEIKKAVQAQRVTAHPPPNGDP